MYVPCMLKLPSDFNHLLYLSSLDDTYYQNFLFKSKAEWEYIYDFQFWMIIIRGTISWLSMVGKRNIMFFQCPFLNQDWNWMTAVDLYSEIFHSELILDCVC